MDEDPVFAGRFARSELRPFKAWLLRGRDERGHGGRGRPPQRYAKNDYLSRRNA